MKKDLEKIEGLKKKLEEVWEEMCLFPNYEVLVNKFSDIKKALQEVLEEPIICHDCGINLDENIIARQSHIIADDFVPRNEYIRLIHHYTKPVGCCKPKYYTYNPIKKFIKGGGLVDVGLPGLAVVACFRDRC